MYLYTVFTDIIVHLTIFLSPNFGAHAYGAVTSRLVCTRVYILNCPVMMMVTIILYHLRVRCVCGIVYGPLNRIKWVTIITPPNWKGQRVAPFRTWHYIIDMPATSMTTTIAVRCDSTIFKCSIIINNWSFYTHDVHITRLKRSWIPIILELLCTVRLYLYFWTLHGHCQLSFSLVPHARIRIVAGSIQLNGTYFIYFHYIIFIHWLD